MATRVFTRTSRAFPPSKPHFTENHIPDLSNKVRLSSAP